MTNLYQEKSVNGCMHVLLSVHGNGLYESQVAELLDFYGEKILNEAETKLYNTRMFELVFGEEYKNKILNMGGNY